MATPLLVSRKWWRGNVVVILSRSSPGRKTSKNWTIIRKCTDDKLTSLAAESALEIGDGHAVASSRGLVESNLHRQVRR